MSTNMSYSSTIVQQSLFPITYTITALDVLFPRNEIALDELLIRSRHRYYTKDQTF